MKETFEVHSCESHVPIERLAVLSLIVRNCVVTVQASHKMKRDGTDTASHSAINVGVWSIPAPRLCPKVATVASQSGGHGRCLQCRAPYVSRSSVSKTSYRRRRANSCKALCDFRLLRATRPSSQLNLSCFRLVSDLNRVRGRVALRRSEGAKDNVRISGSYCLYVTGLNSSATHAHRPSGHPPVLPPTRAFTTSTLNHPLSSCESYL